jgi:hypothetical protein
MARSRYAMPGGSAADLTAAAAERLLDARALLASNRFASAIVMALYALEISLKAKICSRLDLTHLPKPFEIHELDELLILTGLSRKLDDPASIRVKSHRDAIVTGQAKHVNDLRYLPSTHVTQPLALSMVQQLMDPVDGVLAWLASQP